LLASLVPYLSPALGDYRYWDRWEWTPLQRAATWNPPPKAEVASPQPGPGPGPSPNAAEEDISDQELAKLAGLPSAASATADLAQGATASQALLVGDDVLGEQKVWIEGDLQALGPFYKALQELVAGKRQKVRIGHWGDSHIANDGLTHVVRMLLQKRFGDGGHGYTLVQGRTEWYTHKGIERTVSDGWKLYNFLNGNAKDGAYGYGGVSVEGVPGDNFTLSAGAKSPSTQWILYYRSLGKATVAVKIDGKVQAPLQLADSGRDGSQAWAVADGKHSANFRVTAGRVRIHGVAIERDQGLVYDSLGEVGARGTRWTQANAEHLQAVMSDRAPDLLILNYGGNERQDPISEATYTKKMGEAIERLLAGRRDRAGCLLLGPSDHGERDKGKIISDPAIVRIIGWQRKLAKTAGCAFLDARALMGGEGSMGRWVKDGLGWSDYSHFTAAGERYMGQAIYRALLQGLRRWDADQAKKAK
jgi:lysophospholipase L1-like esterase